MDKFPTNIREMTQLFPDAAACAKYLEAVRWPDGRRQELDMGALHWRAYNSVEEPEGR
ncbi:MAG: hypothetical protein AAB322_08535 [Pseudomonadota bacterium]